MVLRVSRSGDISEGHPDPRVSDLRSEFSQRLDSHASAVRDLVDRRLDEKLSKFAELMETYVFQARELASTRGAPVGDTDEESSSSSSSYNRKRLRQRKRE